MKETTKKKLIKTAKIAGMAMTAFFAVLGLAFSAAALKKCSGGEDKRTTLVTLNEKPRKAYETYELSNYIKESYNVTINSKTNTSLSFAYSVNSDIWELDFSTSPYLVINNYIYDIILFKVSNSEEYNHINNCLYNCNTTHNSYTCAELTTLTYLTYASGARFVLEPAEGEHWYAYGTNNRLDYVNVYDLMHDTPIMSVNWGFQWFPWQMMGYAGSNPVILSDISGSFESQHLIELRQLDGFYFRSNGKLYNKIEFMYSWASGSELTDGSGKFYTVSNANAWYIQEVRYYYGDGADDYDVVARFSVFESPTNHYNIPAYGPLSWVAPAFRQIDIVWIMDETALITTNTGSYTLSQWIEILLQPMSGDININVIQGGDPFSLMTTAFDSMKGILSIAVLPGISLGLLLFLPIIAGIIVIILRVVKR